MPKTVRRGQDHNDVGIDIGRWFYIGLVCAVLGWVGGTGIEFTVRGYRTAGDVVEKSREYERLVEENQRAEEDLEYLHTREGEKDAIRRELLYVSEGEQVLEPATEPEPPSAGGGGPWLRSKLDRYHQAVADYLHDVNLHVRCWLGLWTPPGPRDTGDLPDPQQ